MIEVLKAFEEGKEIELYNGERWINENIKHPTCFNFSDTVYRIKPQPTREEITAQWVKDNNIVVGSKIKVFKKVEDEELGWTPQMDCYIGELAYVKDIGDIFLDLGLKNMRYDFPIESLEPYKEEFVPFTWDDRDLFRDRWVINKLMESEFRIIHISKFGLTYGQNFCSYGGALVELEFIDGTPFGKLQ